MLQSIIPGHARGMEFLEFVHGQPCTLLLFSMHMAGHVYNTS